MNPKNPALQFSGNVEEFCACQDLVLGYSCRRVSGDPSQERSKMDARLTMSGMTDVFRHPRQWLAGIHPKRIKVDFR